MSLATVAASTNSAPPPRETGRETAGDAGVGRNFSKMIDAFGGAAAQNDAATEGAGEAASPAVAASAANAETTPLLRAATNLDDALAKIARDVSGGAPSRATKSSPVTSAAPAAASAASAVAASGSQPIDAMSIVRGAKRAGTSDDSSSSSAADSGDAATGDAASQPTASTILLGALAPAGLSVAAGAVGPAVSENVLRALQESLIPAGSAGASSAAQTPPTNAATLRALIGADPGFVVTGAQTRTHLGLDSAARISSAAVQTAAASAAPNASAAAAAANAAIGAPASGSTGKSGANGSLSPRRSAETSGAPPSSSSGDAPAPAGVGPVGKRPVVAATKTGAWQGEAASSAASSKAAAADAATTGLTNALAGPVSLAQLPDAIAEAADGLNATADAVNATPTASAQPVKELQLDLLPAELGAVHVTMRLVDGKLSVVVGVAKSSTLSAIQGERDAIAARLGSDGSPLESLIVTQLDAKPVATADSPDGPTSGSQDNASNGANGQASSSGEGGSRRNGASDAGRRQNWTQSPPARRGAGNLTV